MNKCIGCGDLTEKTLCERCFRIKNYNDYKVVIKDNLEFINILKNINKESLVVLVLDLFNFNDLALIKENLSNDILLVLTKRDLLPKMNDDRILNYNFGINVLDKIIISSKKNYQFDELMYLINKYKKGNNVYIVGYTNSGKSTMINKIIYNYSDSKDFITTSPLPNTTLNTIEIKINDDLTLIDTPGLLDDKNITSYLSNKEFRKVIPNKEIKPKTYQIKEKQYIIIDKYAVIEASNIDLTIFVSNNLEIKRSFKEIDLSIFYKNEVIVNNNDIVINGLGFIKTNKKGNINIYTKDDVLVYTRDSLY